MNILTASGNSEKFSLRAGKFFYENRGWIPVPILAVLLYTSATLSESIWFGMSLVILGQAIRLWGAAYTGRATRSMKIEAPNLVMSGPYAHVRNPLYIANMIMYLGICAVAGSGWPYAAIGILVFFGLQYGFIVRLEEQTLAELHPDEYEQFWNSVPRWFPRLRRAQFQQNMQPSLRLALRAERSTLLSILLVMVLFVVRWQI